MSVINQMLKDLANRSKNINIDEKGLMSLYTFSEKNRKIYLRKKIIFLSTLLVMLTGIVFLSYVNFKSLAHIFLKKTAIIHPISHIRPAILTTITLQVEKNTTRLHLLLNKKPLYHLVKLNNNELMLVLEKTHGITSEPQINVLNSAIQAMHVLNEANGNFKIILKLKEGAELNTLELNEANKLPELDVDFSYSPQASLTLPAIIPLQKNTLKKVIDDLTIEERYQQALELIDEGHFSSAMLKLKKIITEDPNFYSAEESLISLLIEKGNITDAEQNVEASLKLAPTYIPFLQLKARILVANGKTKEALNLLQQYSPSMEEYPDYHALLAALEQQQGQFLASAELYKKLVEFEPVNAVWWMGLGISLEKLGHTYQALEAYAKADHIDDFNPELKAYVENRMTYLE